MPLPELETFLLSRSDGVFASDSGTVHRVHCLTRGDAASFSGDTQLEYRQWPQRGPE